MIGLDTNVLLAWILAGQARRLPAADSYRVSHVALAELVWVLVRTMKYTRQQVQHVLQALLASADVHIDRAEVVKAAFANFKTGRADFADFLIACDNAAAGCRTTVTLDKIAAKEPNFSPLES